MEMLTIKKRSRFLWIVAVIVAGSQTGCGPPGAREFRKGEEFMQAGDYTNAVAVISDGLKLMHDGPPAQQARALNLLGLAYQNAGELDDASRAYESALKLNRNLWVADYNLGCLRMQQTNFVGAVDYFTTYTTSNPRDVNGVLLLARSHLELAMQVRSGAERARQLEGARLDYEYAETLKSTAEACNALGLIQLQQVRTLSADRMRTAISLFQTALERDPHYGPALLNLAIVLQNYANEPKDALADYQQYLALQPAPPQAADVAKIAHDLDVKLRISMVPENGVVTQNPAPTPTRPAPVPVATRPANPAPQPVVQPVQPVKPAPAQPVSAPSVASTPPESSAPPVTTRPAATAPPNEVASAPSSTTETSTAEAPEEKRTFIQRLNPMNWFSSHSRNTEPTAMPLPVEPANPDRYTYPLPVIPIPGDRKKAEQLMSAGREAQRNSDREQAMEDFQQATKIDPTYFEPAMALGMAAIDAKDYPTASDALGQALMLQPDSADARYAFAWVLGRRGYYQDAVIELRKLLSARPNELRAHLLLGNFYSDNLGDIKLAREQYTKALALMDQQSAQAAVIKEWLEKH
jgi:tetratricopeptide (TPR) repeat protein